MTQEQSEQAIRMFLFCFGASFWSFVLLVGMRAIWRMTGKPKD